jgi:SAM-dependent methyltransferase
VTVGDADVVSAEFATDERLERRRLDRWAIYLGPDPREHAVLAVWEGGPRRVLDAGCGTGELAASLAGRLGVEAFGVDQSERMVELARARGLAAEVAAIEELPFPDGSFDAVIATWVLHFLRDLDSGLAELARVLRPGGRLVALTNSERHLEELWGLDSDMTFTRENGGALLARRFARVARRDLDGEVVFATPAALRGYVEAFAVLGTKPVRPLEELPMPLRASTRNTVFVAERAA